MTNLRQDKDAAKRFLEGAADDIGKGKEAVIINCHGQKSWLKAAVVGIALSAAALAATPAHAGILGSILGNPEQAASHVMNHIYEANGAVGAMQGASMALRYANGDPASIADGVAQGIGAVVQGGAAVLGFFGGHKKQEVRPAQPVQQVQPQVNQSNPAGTEGEVVRQVDGPWHNVGPSR